MAVTDIQRVLKIWKMRNRTLERKIVTFKTKAISKIVFQSFIRTVPKHITSELEKKKQKQNKKLFLWRNFTPKIKHKTLCNAYTLGGL